jgi:signal transduction histidine kinase
MATEVRVEVTRAEQLIDALLTLARSERPLAQSHRLDLALLVEEALEESRRSDLETTTSLSEAPVLGDPVLLGRLVGNLLDNAQQYNIPGGRIAVSTGNVNGGCEVRVVNTGPVIPPADVDRLFEPFTRLDDRTRHDGFGLGLALVHAVARAHHGTVFASAVPTGGLDVSVNLPLDPTLTVKSVLVDSRPDR